jgi:hypothetical protein
VNENAYSGAYGFNSHHMRSKIALCGEATPLFGEIFTPTPVKFLAMPLKLLKYNFLLFTHLPFIKYN